ncbi:hypothetical protein EMCG_07262 [[Emmonsia] crescens]|uniref:Uncharacterized protein n=1 Tax=[Emmonsia] crescens TaxID=73230 RepID=A0A0G2I9V2_9EURO|nr:hypothetical protein EMCG_07262 [Emmonsia crescens UAMH 3008]
MLDLTRYFLTFRTLLQHGVMLVAKRQTLIWTTLFVRKSKQLAKNSKRGSSTTKHCSVAKMRKSKA